MNSFNFSFLFLFLFSFQIFSVSSLECSDSASQLQFAYSNLPVDFSPSLLVSCPLNCAVGSATEVSLGVFSLSSSICLAALMQLSRVANFVCPPLFEDSPPLNFSSQLRLTRGSFTIHPQPSYVYRYGEYSECSKFCGGGVQRRSVDCVDFFSGSVAPLSHCPNPEPITIRHCNARPCAAPVNCQSRFQDLSLLFDDHASNKAAGRKSNADLYFDADTDWLRVQCPSDCVPNLFSDVTLNIYGSNPYTDRSLVCVSAFHANDESIVNGDQGDQFFMANREPTNGVTYPGSASPENGIQSQAGSSASVFGYRLKSGAIKDAPVPPYFSYALTHRQFSSCSASCGGGIQFANPKCVRLDNSEPSKYKVVDSANCTGQEDIAFHLNQTCAPQPCPIDCQMNDRDSLFAHRDSVLVQCPAGCDSSSAVDSQSICSRALRSRIISPSSGGFVLVYPGIGINFPPCNSPAWESIGPHHVQLRGAFTGGMENVRDPSVIGAISSIAFLHPLGSRFGSATDVALVSSTNGGVWRTSNIHDPHPDFQPMTDSQLVNSVGHLFVDRADPNWVVASLGGFSSLNYFSGEWKGIMQSFDGGFTWNVTDKFPFGYSIAESTTCSRSSGSTEPFSRSSDVQSRVIVSVAGYMRSQRYSGSAGGSWYKARFGGGIFRSADGGSSWTQVHHYRTFKIESHPLNCSILFAPAINPVNQSSVVLRSMDGGLSWEELFVVDYDAIPFTSTHAAVALIGPTNAVISIHATNNNTPASIYLGFFNSDSKQSDGYAFFLSRDLGATWEFLDQPVSAGKNGEGKTGLGGQGDIHFSGLADPTNPNVFYVGGTAQQSGNEFQATASSSRLFRVVYSETADPKFVWFPLVLTDTPSATSVHADSRCFTWDPTNNWLLNGNDGGIYYRPNPAIPLGGDWAPLNGDLQISEIHSIAWDWRSGFVAAGAQDNSIFYTRDFGSKEWIQTGSGDGGKVLVDTTKVDQNNDTLWYNCAQNLANFVRTSTGSINSAVQQYRWPTLHPTSQAKYFHFQEMYTLNAVDSNKMMVCANPVFVHDKTSDATCWELDFSTHPNLTRLTGVHTYDCYRFGGFRNGAGDFNVILGIANLTVLSENSDRSYVFSVSIINRYSDIPIVENVPLWGQCKAVQTDPTNYYHSYFVDDRSHVFQTRNFGEAWRNITGNLFSITKSIEQPFAWTLAIVPYFDSKRNNERSNAILLGTARGIYISFDSDYADDRHWTPSFTGFNWQYFSVGIPNVLILDIQYSPNDDQLFVAAFGRGGWKIGGVALIIQRMRESQTCAFTAAPFNLQAGKHYLMEAGVQDSSTAGNQNQQSSSSTAAATSTTSVHHSSSVSSSLSSSSSSSSPVVSNPTGPAAPNSESESAAEHETHLIRNSVAMAISLMVFIGFVVILHRTIKGRRAFLSAAERLASRGMEMPTRTHAPTAVGPTHSSNSRSPQQQNNNNNNNEARV